VTTRGGSKVRGEKERGMNIEYRTSKYRTDPSRWRAHEAFMPKIVEEKEANGFLLPFVVSNQEKAGNII